MLTGDEKCNLICKVLMKFMINCAAQEEFNKQYVLSY